MANFVFIQTDHDLDSEGNPFFWRSESYGPRIRKALIDVFDGVHCPLFEHYQASDGATGFIVVASEEVTEAAARAAFEEWVQASFKDDFDDSAVFEFPLKA